MQSIPPSPSCSSTDDFAVPDAGPNEHSPTLWWLSDTAGAVMFAACLALYLNGAAAPRSPAAAGLLLGGLALSGLLRGLIQGLAQTFGQHLATVRKHALRRALLAALLPTGLVRGKLVGEDLRVAIDDVEAQEGLVAVFQPLKRAATLSPLMIAAAIAFASWVSALILMATMIPFALGMALLGKAGKEEAEKQHHALSRLSGLFVDRVSTLPVILSFAAEDRIARQIGTAAHEVAERTMQVLRVAFLSSAALEFFSALSIALVAVYCGFSLLGLLPFPAPETLTLGRAFFALTLAPEFYLGMRRLAAAYHEKQQGEAAKDSIEAALASARAALPAPQARPATTATMLAAEGLYVRYPDGNAIGPIDAVWHGPDLHAVTGQTGAGKSSLLHALVGLAPEISGTLRLDGAALAPGALQSMAGWAGQRALLLPGTLEDNLLLGRDDTAPLDPAGLHDLLAACDLSRLVGERGLALPIDPRGSGLSGGERRRIGLVRAIVSARPILLLDEPTADLDPATAARITELIVKQAQTRLVIVATHDEALAARAVTRIDLT